MKNLIFHRLDHTEENGKCIAAIFIAINKDGTKEIAHVLDPVKLYNEQFLTGNYTSYNGSAMPDYEIILKEIK